MAWNEPGGGKDPWNSKGGGDGPPDLDEVVKKLRDNLGNLLGHGGNGDRREGGSGGRPGGLGMLGVWVGVVVFALIWLATGFYTVAPAENGVELRFGAYLSVTRSGLNWHLPFPIDTVVKVNVDQVSSFRHKAQMLTKDENIVDVELTVQSRIKDPVDYLFQDYDPQQTMQDATETAVRETIGKSQLDYILTEGRSAVADMIKQRVQEIVNTYNTGLEITSVNMQPARPPEAVKASFDDAIKAREDRARSVNQAEAYKNEVVPKARGGAARRIEDATAYREKVIAQAQGEAARFSAVLAQYEKAPEVTRNRLYIETVESVLSKNQKVLVDVPDGNNLMYLPLDRMMGPRTDSLSSERAPQQATALPPVVEQGSPPQVEREVNRSRRSR